MRITLQPAQDWQVEGGVWTSGPLRIETDRVTRDVPPGASFDMLLTHESWALSIAEFVDTGTAYLLATISLAGEIAGIRAQCLVEHMAAARPRLIELLQTARPSWPDTILLSDLLALPLSL